MYYTDKNLLVFLRAFWIGFHNNIMVYVGTVDKTLATHNVKLRAKRR